MRRLKPVPHTNFVGQVGNLRPIGNRPVSNSVSNTGRITNPPQVTNLPHTISTNLRSCNTPGSTRFSLWGAGKKC
jgi:hypothetical protein